MLFVLSTLAALPWLSGYEPAAVDDHGARDVQAELAPWQGEADPACVASTYGGLRISAGDHTVLASYTQGVVVLGADRGVVARAPGFTCYGSADQLVALAEGQGGLDVPVIALAATSGGRAENATWIALYRVGDHGDLEPIFTAIVERHIGRLTHTGSIEMFQGGLRYRSPDGDTSVWLYDRETGKYVPQAVPENVA
ncbi:MAG TPA: hypothetical protein VGF94_21710 [Kofleriaceae bacterium]|jgi:hypothetical protein